jgi:hypothetical protein
MRPPEQHTCGAVHAGPIPHAICPVPCVPMVRTGPPAASPPLLPAPVLLPLALPLPVPLLLPLALPLPVPLLLPLAAASPPPGLLLVPPPQAVASASAKGTKTNR